MFQFGRSMAPPRAPTSRRTSDCHVLYTVSESDPFSPAPATTHGLHFHSLTPQESRTIPSFAASTTARKTCSTAGTPAQSNAPNAYAHPAPTIAHGTHAVALSSQQSNAPSGYFASPAAQQTCASSSAPHDAHVAPRVHCAPVMGAHVNSLMPQQTDASNGYHTSSVAQRPTTSQQDNPAPTSHPASNAHGLHFTSLTPEQSKTMPAYLTPTAAHRSFSNAGTPQQTYVPHTTAYPPPSGAHRTHSNASAVHPSAAPNVFQSPAVAFRTYSNSTTPVYDTTSSAVPVPTATRRTFSIPSSGLTPKDVKQSCTPSPRFPLASGNAMTLASPDGAPSCPATPIVLSRACSNVSVENFMQQTTRVTASLANREHTIEESRPTYFGVAAPASLHGENNNGSDVAPQYAAGMIATPLSPNKGNTDGPAMMHMGAISESNRPRLSFTSNSTFEDAHTLKNRKQREKEESRKYELAKAREEYEAEVAKCEAEKQKLQALRTECRLLEEHIDFDQSLDSRMDKEYADYAASEEQMKIEVRNAERGGPTEFDELTAKLSSTKSIQQKCVDTRKATKENVDEMEHLIHEIDKKLVGRQKELAAMQEAISASTDNFNAMSDTLKCSIDKRRKETEKKTEYIKNIVDETLPKMRQETEELNAKIIEKNAERERLQLTESVEVTRLYKAAVEKVAELNSVLTERRVGYTKMKEDLAFQQEQSQTLVREYTDLLVKQEARGVGERAGMTTRGSAHESRNAGDRVGMMTQGQVQKEELENIEQLKKKCVADLKVVEQGLKNCPSPMEEGEKRAKTKRLRKRNFTLRSENDMLRKAIGATN